ncbi:protein phosphatase domain-containing protein [Entamoeba histolytica HM-1:IMSS]|uniref:Protein phosphatase domain-containing protein n=7 Tax=Entamoeba histolytica TaxID=5759 RepID=C4LUM6_ENTH1|nr:protein phosphatase domain-containing protein [Entamoeba histolytica HM-1:IMSS]EAL50236.2 protein phosphatase domain-containing protein [Entamoeba histolytica HM-1:IMSS]|eukprot:XP_655658.2 protein phosphatase domain-containing protein [Entamoeba histolytica HM-1:IMSS]
MSIHPRFSSFFEISEVSNSLEHSVYLKSTQGMLFQNSSFLVILSSLPDSSILCDEGKSSFLMNSSTSLLPIVSDRVSYFCGYMTTYLSLNEKVPSSCLIFINMKSQNIINEILSSISKTLSHCKVITVIRINNNDIVIKDQFERLPSCMSDHTIIPVPSQSLLELIKTYKNEEKEIEVIIATDEVKFQTEIFPLIREGHSITLLCTEEEGKMQNDINLYHGLDCSVIHHELNESFLQKIFERIRQKEKLTNIKYNENAIAIQNAPKSFVKTRKSLMFMCPAMEINEIMLGNKIPERSPISCVEAVLYLFHQMKQWSVCVPKLNAKTMIREEVVKRRCIRQKTTETRRGGRCVATQLTRGCRDQLKEQGVYNSSLCERTKEMSDTQREKTKAKTAPRRGLVRMDGVIGLTREDKIKKFQNVIQKTQSDVLGLDSIKLVDVKDRIVNGYLKKYQGKCIPMSFNDDVQRIMESQKWEEIGELKEGNVFVSTNKIDELLNNVEIKDCERKGERKVWFSRSSSIGPKKRMEDFDVFVEDMKMLSNKTSESIAFFGVFDGHLGTSTADYCSFKIYNEIIRHKEFPNNLKRVVCDAIYSVENGFKPLAEKLSANAGTTAAIALITERNIITANVGDTEIVLCRKGMEPEVLSTRHIPKEENEKKRIEEAGGKVYNNNGWRVEGLLGVSRSIGDEPLKTCVTCEPSIFEKELKGDEEFLVIASDGFWDVFSYENATAIIRSFLEKEQFVSGVDEDGICLPKNLKDMARYLVDVAIKRKTLDNVTVSICFFNNHC